jgi:hypothetical protein
VHLSVTVFGADYDDFIESKASLGFDPASGRFSEVRSYDL